MEGEQRGPWMRRSTTQITQGKRFAAYADEVTDPGGGSGRYEWVETPDLVRVAALTGDGRIWLAEQYHYLPKRRMLQAVGGGVDPGEEPQVAAARELAEETGLTAARWRSLGAVWPLPGLSPARIHLFAAEDLRAGTAHPEAAEADLEVKAWPLAEAVAAALDGRIGCAASAQLVLTVAEAPGRR
ncbi:NUDIX domain-containing protein [Paractinoplanes durhamensis]|uniref:NUDIX domain-containing protein n=1 Tax=Paractinoplanes durhamensis TaxID=113563 RepID=UPI001EF2B11D|nr:NUDIX hydrolase [Actinoplanes durhamensis]